MSREHKVRKTALRRTAITQKTPSEAASENRPKVAGYSGTPLWKKLGYRDGIVACLDGPPTGYAASLQLPPDVSVQWLRRPTPGIGFIHLFTISKSVLKTKLLAFRNTLAPSGVLWVSWPKKSAGVASDVSEDVVREVALPLGLVDIKVCAVDNVWSGLKLVIRKELR